MCPFPCWLICLLASFWSCIHDIPVALIKDHDHQQLPGESSFWPWLFPRFKSIVTKEEEVAGAGSWQVASFTHKQATEGE